MPLPHAQRAFEFRNFHELRQHAPLTGTLTRNVYTKVINDVVDTCELFIDFSNGPKDYSGRGAVVTHGGSVVMNAAKGLYFGGCADFSDPVTDMLPGAFSGNGFIKAKTCARGKVGSTGIAVVVKLKIKRPMADGERFVQLYSEFNSQNPVPGYVVYMVGEFGNTVLKLGARGDDGTVWADGNNLVNIPNGILELAKNVWITLAYTENDGDLNGYGNLLANVNTEGVLSQSWGSVVPSVTTCDTIQIGKCLETEALMGGPEGFAERILLGEIKVYSGALDAAAVEEAMSSPLRGPSGVAVPRSKRVTEVGPVYLTHIFGGGNRSGVERSVTGVQVMRQDYLAMFPATADIISNDRFTVRLPQQDRTKTFDVELVQDAGGVVEHVQAFLREVS